MMEIVKKGKRKKKKKKKKGFPFLFFFFFLPFPWTWKSPACSTERICDFGEKTRDKEKADCSQQQSIAVTEVATFFCLFFLICFYDEARKAVL
jgi:hypothetical protein